MKKLIPAALVCAMILSAGTTTAFAHGGRHGAARPYPVCTVEGCDTPYAHSHDGEYYCGHTAGDGHVHAQCALSGCNETGVHQHDGAYYYGCASGARDGTGCRGGGHHGGRR